jgi:signal transduction histidine kinase
MTINWRRYLDDHRRAVDAAVVLHLFGLSVFGSRLNLRGLETAPSARWPAALLAGIACAALLLARSHPRVATAVTASCATTLLGLGYVPTPLLLAPFMAALYWLAARTDRSTTRTCVIITATATVAAALHSSITKYPNLEGLELWALAPAAWALLAAAMGTASRLRLANLEAAQVRAEYAERTREEEARLRVAEERMRIARELHDVAAHHLALANAQAGAVARLVRGQPDQIQKSVAELANTTSAALRDLKATVGLLREANDADAPLAPAPGLAQLADLTTSMQAAGLTVTVATEGEPQPLSPTVDLTAYRIVQEALTNVAKHAAGTEAHVRLAYHHQLRITVTNDAGGAATSATTSGDGYGLIGMRERAHAVGGRLRADRRPAGGFEIATDLPLHPQTPDETRGP